MRHKDTSRILKRLNEMSPPSFTLPSSSSPSNSRKPISVLLLLHLLILILSLTSASLTKRSSISRHRSPFSSKPTIFSNFTTLFSNPQKNSIFFFINEITDTTNSTITSISKVIIRGNKTISSKNGTFMLGFFTPNEGSSWYLGIWFSQILTPTYIWVANRETPITNSSTSLEITERGRLTVKNSEKTIIWESTNSEIGTRMDLLENGNLVLLTETGTISWQSFDYPSDTWLPGMNMTKERSLTSWRSLSDPSPGFYSLRLKPSDYGEFELVFNGTKVYWTTGKWNGEAFANVPEMMSRYIYVFYFIDPFKPTASFGFTERALDNGLLPLTRFHMDYSGQLKQYTWSQQINNWNRFWSQPDNICRVYGVCGNLGICNSKTLKPCDCLSGFSPVDELKWNSDDFSGGCRRVGTSLCSNDGFEKVGAVGFEGDYMKTFSNNRDFCERACLGNCTCVGFDYNQGTNLCRNFYGTLLDLRNLSSDSTGAAELYVRVQKGGGSSKKSKLKLNPYVLSGSVAGSIALFGFLGMMVLAFLRRRKSGNGVDEDGVFIVSSLKMFSYKELHVATRGFSEKLGHGGFGAVFRGELLDSITIAVKRLERHGSGGENEFRAEVCTIGNIQHVNLARLRGFCSENSHRLLVYDYMPNGPLSHYLRRDGPVLSWDVRFRVAVGTARGIAYLHEECRDCIIHCDIKPENILLDTDFTAKVSDFGLAKLIGRDFSRVLATMRGTWGYVAPEWISGVAITTKADVYSYGMTLFELIGGRRNAETPPGAEAKEGGNGTGDKWFFPPWAAREIIGGNVAAIIDHRLGNEYNITEAERVALVAVWCIQDEEEARPKMGTVVKMLAGVVEVTVPPAPKLLQALVSGESFHGVKAQLENIESFHGCKDCSDNIVPAGGECSDYDNVRVSSGGSESSVGGNKTDQT